MLSVAPRHDWAGDLDPRYRGDDIQIQLLGKVQPSMGAIQYVPIP